MRLPPSELLMLEGTNRETHPPTPSGGLGGLFLQGPITGAAIRRGTGTFTNTKKAWFTSDTACAAAAAPKRVADA